MHAGNASAGETLGRAYRAASQDYEVDAMLGLGLAGKGKGGKVAQLATAFERSGLHNVDNVSTISRSMMNKAIEKGVAAGNIIFFPNWSEIAVSACCRRRC
ncbi:hypothetical protein ACNKHR_23805 [Shigella flexneri]